jgi:F-type H+-transporting ATPase subunit delta
VRRVSTLAARRYAQALLDVALEKGEPAKLREELDAAVGLLEEHAELRRILAHPAVDPERKKKIVAAVFGRGASELLLRLLELLVARGRIALLPAIREAYVSRWNAHRKVVAAEVVAARPLADTERSALVQAIQQTTGLGVELQAREDPALIGGLLLRMGGRTFDGSARAQLRALRQRLAQDTR